MIQIDYNDGKFQFDRDNETGIGTWICLTGRVPGHIGIRHDNLFVPVIFGNELTKFAVDTGIPRSFFVSKIHEKKATKTDRVKTDRVSR